jgi:hypothetical protein
MVTTLRRVGSHADHSAAAGVRAGRRTPHATGVGMLLHLLYRLVSPV